MLFQLYCSISFLYSLLSNLLSTLPVSKLQNNVYIMFINSQQNTQTTANQCRHNRIVNCIIASIHANSRRASTKFNRLGLNKRGHCT